ncbi:hypothetical protein [Paraburkholderia sp. J8-2]|uniref:hypothetical protein n=1 Tax=Paraburkholderia sp. J8-2 TaxID=2805440 RepID=UPI002AB67482|nr:hypothetical protein [Paraburkholderia sp. J8-2]
MVYGGAFIFGYVLFNWHPWAAIFPAIGAWVAIRYYKYLYRQDVYVFEIRKVYNKMADAYHPWQRESLKGSGRRPRGYGRGLRC